jgi:hypothetical protein
MCLDLLVAFGLEQSVEALHHRTNSTNGLADSRRSTCDFQFRAYINERGSSMGLLGVKRVRRRGWIRDILDGPTSGRHGCGTVTPIRLQCGWRFLEYDPGKISPLILRASFLVLDNVL